jgi:hypothetical protein
MKSIVIQEDPPQQRTNWVARHPLVSFFVLAYVLAWGGVPWDSFFAPGALIAALIVAYLKDGWAGLRDIGARLVRWRVHWVWYVLAVAVPLLLHAVTIGLNLAAGAPTPTLDQFSTWYGIPLAIGIGIVNPTGGQFSEEPSFRGFAVPILQGRHTQLVGAAILAVAVTGWHLPLYFMAGFSVDPIEMFATVACTFWYWWLFTMAGGSSLLTLISHATEGGVATRALWPAGPNDTREVYLYTLVWVVFALGLVLLQRRFWSSRLRSTP